MTACRAGAYVASAVMPVGMIPVHARRAGLDIEKICGDVAEQRILPEVAVYVFLVGNAIDPVTIGVAEDVAAG